MVIRVATANCNGMVNKMEFIIAAIISIQVDVLLIQESKIDESIREEIVIPGFTSFLKDRNRNGGGVISYVRNSLSPKAVRLGERAGLEIVGVECKLPGGNNATILNLYSPPSQAFGEEFNEFWDSLSDVLAELETESVVLSGDFN